MITSIIRYSSYFSIFELGRLNDRIVWVRIKNLHDKYKSQFLKENPGTYILSCRPLNHNYFNRLSHVIWYADFYEEYLK